MFTGLIRDVGCVRAIDKGGVWRMVIATALDLEALDIGASIACSGCCLSIVGKDGDSFAVEVSAETLAKTGIGRWEPGTPVNLEPSLRLGEPLGGHLVSGHVDGQAELTAISRDGACFRLQIRAPAALAPLIAAKGSVALDGVSLTVNEVAGATFGVNIIPHTWAQTSLSANSEGDALNIEVDMLARYVARILDAGSAS